MAKIVEIPIYITFAGSVTIELKKGESLEKLDVKELEKRALEQYFLNESIVDVATTKTDVKADGRHAKYYDIKKVRNKVHKGFYDFWEKQWKNE